MKIQFGSGSNILNGWINTDIGDVDITKVLPYEENSVDLIFIEHCLEHVTTPDAVRFFMESYRILKSNGVIRVAVPSVIKILDEADEEYLQWFGNSGFGFPTKRSAVQSILLNHGHLSAWDHSILGACLFAAGFEENKIFPFTVGHSATKELCGVEGHGKVIGDHNNKIETIIMEAIK
jgi:predicted SAM-dependent methyltransferase